MKKVLAALMLLWTRLFGHGEEWTGIETMVIREAKNLGIPPEYALTLLQLENDQQNPSALFHNRDGSVDIGLFQLNSKYIDYYVERFWEPREALFSAYDPLQNTIVALSYWRFLYEFLGSARKAYAAYNCGIYATKEDILPETTVAYLNRMDLVYEEVVARLRRAK